MRLLRVRLKRWNLVVSIHAPAWGATDKRLWLEVEEQFQSTHPHGVRLFSAFCSNSTECFNPRTRMGCDSGLALISFLPYVSIHAPAWGATLVAHAVEFSLRFQSTHPHGVRLYTDNGICPKGMFQSTHPHGVRLSVNSTRLKLAMFQSTHPHGVRP